MGVDPEALKDDSLDKLEYEGGGGFEACAVLEDGPATDW